MPPKQKFENHKSWSRKSNVPKAKKIALKSSSPMKRRSKISENIKTQNRKSNVPKAKKIALKSSSRMKTRSKTSTVPKTSPKNKKKIQPIPSSSTADSSFTPIEESKKPKNEMDLVTPKMMRYYLNAYKQSPDYRDLKNKRFNTSFFHERPRGDRDIQIFPPEERPPVNENRMAPGDKYANVFFNMIGLSSDSDEDIIPEEVKEMKGKRAGNKGKRGRKKSIGYKRVPLSDEAMMIDYSDLFSKREMEKIKRKRDTW